ncbi:MAG TPA: acyloxyacyl hydrolase [Thermoanaerobaculia bacterium]|nr:acyloxyacyl hydrolase [Thermoanaerobaculia bacterium]
MKRLRDPLFVLPLLGLLAAPLGAEEPASIAAGIGEVEPIVDGAGVELAWEVRFAPRRFHLLSHFAPKLSPIAGALATSRGALYAYAGLRWDLPLGEHWTLSPSWALGLYHREDGQDLGGPIEFRSGLELAYRLDARSLLGISLYHLSNGGLFDNNPGSESLLFLYSTHLRMRSRR